MRNARLLLAVSRTLLLGALSWAYVGTEPSVEGACATGCTIKHDTQGQITSISCDLGKPGNDCYITGTGCVFNQKCS